MLSGESTELKNLFVNMEYMVEERCYEDILMFKIRPHEGEGRVKIVHHHMLLPLKQH